MPIPLLDLLNEEDGLDSGAFSRLMVHVSTEGILAGL